MNCLMGWGESFYLGGGAPGLGAEGWASDRLGATPVDGKAGSVKVDGPSTNICVSC